MGCELVDVDKFDRIIEPGQTFRNVFEELWSYRGLFYFLALRDFKVRYKQTLIGVLWAALRPLLTMLVFTVVFSKLAGLPAEGGAPYPIMVFAAMLPWFLFASSFQEGSNALVANANMVSKVYFPRVIVPVSSLFVNFVDFAISFALLFLLMIYYDFSVSSRFFFLPIFLLLAILFTVSVTLWMSALNVKYRDVRYIVPFIVQIGLYVTPVGFSSTTVPEQWRMLYSLNPMVGVVDGFRWCLLGQEVQFYLPGLVASVAITGLLFVTGLVYFGKTERRIADII